MPTSRFAPTLLTLTSLLALALAPAHGPIASLVRDLNAAGNAAGGSTPHDFVTLGRRVAVTAFEPSSGWEV